jgi:hypothetical protein
MSESCALLLLCAVPGAITVGASNLPSKFQRTRDGELLLLLLLLLVLLLLLLLLCNSCPAARPVVPPLAEAQQPCWGVRCSTSIKHDTQLQT